MSSADLPQNFCVGTGEWENDQLGESAWQAIFTGLCETFSAINRKFPGVSASPRTNSYVSPNIGLKGLRMARSRARPFAKYDTAKAATWRRRWFVFLISEAVSRREAYSRASARRWRREMGSLAETGMLIVLRSLPTFLRRKEIRLGGSTVAGGMSIWCLTGLSGKGVRLFGFVGNSDAAP